MKENDETKMGFSPYIGMLRAKYSIKISHFLELKPDYKQEGMR
jgi:hypothetical protein